MALAVGLFLLCGGAAAGTFVGSQIPFGQYPQPDDTEVLAPTVPDQPVRLLVNFCYVQNAVVAPPVATVWGMEIQVTQTVTFGGAEQACALYLIDLGKLPYGTYHVTTTRSFVNATWKPTPREFRFIVQAGKPSASCNGTQFVTTAPDGGALVRYETDYLGYAPSFGVPSVEFQGCCQNGQSISITQLATDIAGMPQSPVCHAEEVNLGRLPDGVYTLSLSYLPNVPFAGPRTPELKGFRWENGAAQCSNLPSFSTRGSLLSTEPFDLVHTQLGSFFFSQFTVKVRGSVITVDETAYLDDVPFNGPSGCATGTVSVDPLPAGDYTVNWTTHTTGNLRPDETTSFNVTITDPPSALRRRAARH